MAGLFAGVVADRSDKRALLMVVQSLAIVQSFCLAALATMDRPPLAAVYALAVLRGCAVAFDNLHLRTAGWGGLVEDLG